MGTFYNRIAGKNVDRLAALSDGVFAIAMTLLVLDLRVPAANLIHSQHDLQVAIVALLPRFIPYVMSFLTLGIFWVGQQAQLNILERSDRNVTWTHISFLLAVSLVPFSTALLAQFLSYRAALFVYWLNLLMLGGTLYAAWRYAKGRQLIVATLTPEIAKAIERRILVAQSLYAFGALLSTINTYWSIGFIVLVQLNYALAPRIRPLSEL